MSRFEMDAATLAQLSRLLDEALERPSATRDSWIDTLGSQFDALKPHLRDLLSRSGAIETDDFLHTIPKIRDADVRAREASEKAGEVVGLYRLVRELGAGGMGAVWLAERVDGLIQRKVALKLPHIVTPRRAELAERMAREREILASLDHPNIARLFDAGLTAKGQPYLALEYVEGVPLDRYCLTGTGAGTLPIAERLRLFLQVASAVAYAHGKLVVHRDLKPANVLVTPGGEVRLLDFGIAKLLDGGDARGSQLTQLSGGAFTPDYASPEQILGRPLTVASDVYSLGVILFELLSGARPYKLARTSRGALEDAIVQIEPARLSDCATAALQNVLRGDLDTIVMKALKKDPQDRYATVNALADDIARYLANRPVLARPDSALYRVRKFIARNRLWVGAAGMVIVAVLAGTSVAVWQAHRARLEESRAQTVKSVLVGMFENADPYSNGGKSLRAADLLLQASKELARDPVGDAAVRAEIANVLAGSLFRLNEDDASEQLAATAYADMAKVLPAEDLQVVRMRILLAEQLRFRGKTAEARAHLDAISIPLRSFRTSSPKDFIYGQLIDADLSIEEDNDQRAIALSKAVYDESVRLLGPHDTLTVRALTTLGRSLLDADQREQAVSTARKALELANTVFRDRPHSPQLMETRATYAAALVAQGKYAEAVKLDEAILHEETETHGENSLEVGLRLQNMSIHQVLAGQIKEGIYSASQATAIARTRFEPVSRMSVATRWGYARALIEGRKAEQAREVLAGIQGDIAQLLGAEHSRTLEARASYALALAWCGDSEQALAVSEATLKSARAQGSEASLVPLQARARIAYLADDFPTAVKLERELLAVKDASLSQPARAVTLAGLGKALLAVHDSKAARENLIAASALLDGLGHRATPLRAEVDLGLVELDLADGRADLALPRAITTDAFWRDFDAQNPGAGDAAFWLASAELALGHAAQARADFARAAAILRDSKLPGDRRKARRARSLL
jgi:serine/threonine protein kinase